MRTDWLHSFYPAIAVDSNLLCYHEKNRWKLVFIFSERKSKLISLSPLQFTFIHKRVPWHPVFKGFSLLYEKNSFFCFSSQEIYILKGIDLETQKFPCKFTAIWIELRQGKGTVICAEWSPISLQERKKDYSEGKNACSNMLVFKESICRQR